MTSYDKISCRKAKGITLIALVITIVILIILATVAVSFVFGEEGLISRAQQAAEMTERQELIEQIELTKAEVAAENGGKVTAEDFFEKLEENGIIGSVEGDVTDNGDGTFTVITNDGHEIEVTVTEDGKIEIEYIGKGEGPRIIDLIIEKTTKSIKITVETKKAEKGKFTYLYKKNDEGEEDWQEVEGDIENNICIIDNLEANEIYNIKVKVTTNMGTAERTVNVQLREMPQGKVNFGNHIWQGDGTANIVINSTENEYTLQYQIVRNGDSIDASKWEDTITGKEISGLRYGDTVYGRLWDGKNTSDHINVTIDDKIAPQEATIQLSDTITDVNGSITATITMVDNESGVDLVESKWVYNTNSGNVGLEESSYTKYFEGTDNPATITLQATTIGTYYLHVLTKDIAGNKVEKVSEAIIVEEPLEPGDPVDKILVAGPQVASGMTPVKYIDGIGWVKTTEIDREWYNYGEKRWANVVLGGASFTTSGEYEVLNETASYSMLVWIPRYAYKITSMYRQGGAGAGNIEIVFLNAENKDKNGVDYSSKTTYPSASMQSGMSDFVVHPAFSWDGKALEGLWIGKYETSSNGGNVQIKAGVESWSDINISQMFTTCLGMNSYGNSYGLNTNDSVVDPHMMKNTEWGVVTYLTQSIYGKNSEVAINNSSDYYTGGGRGTSYRTNVVQSTTGDVTGIYDMSGGRGEYVAACYGNGSSYGSSIQSASTRYKDIYTSDYYDIPTSTSKSPYGDAVYETKRLV